MWWVLIIIRTSEQPFPSVNIPIHSKEAILCCFLPICIGGAIYRVVK